MLALLVVLLATREPSTDRQADSPLLSRVAPPIVGTTLDGEAYDLDDRRGEWVVVNFFATWCVPCRTEHPELVSFSRRHQARGDASVVSVVFSDGDGAVRRFFAEEGGEWPVVSGDDGRIALDYGVARVPESYLVSPSGVVVAKLVGGVTGDGLDELLARYQGAAAGEAPG